MKILEDMKKLGFSEYEAKAYLGLLEAYPLTGYGLSKASGIPRSRIYEVLNNLVEKQMVFLQCDEDSNLYYPLEPKLFIEKVKSDMDVTIENIEAYTKDIFDVKREDQRMISITNYDDIIGFLELLISHAKYRVALSIWENEIILLEEALEKAEKRGVLVCGIYMGKRSTFRELVPHRRIDRLFAEMKERNISVVIDSEQVVAGVMSRGKSSRVSWIKDTGFAEMTEDFLSHDVVINTYASTIDGEMKAHFENTVDESRRQFYNYSKEELKTYKEKG